ncbi:hypothetical protein RHMOL_Rhmol02G0071700 [Rhododendron molle]|uniref:Uncharacterized protein n=1 Tax=Rhododendron molle TaxID=49168 RepID=A0ACC0PNW6_RHOML|nr:hypothetical protein RHMOL_Rhmol02G0071700 [Rhododendron molle]
MIARRWYDDSLTVALMAVLFDDCLKNWPKVSLVEGFDMEDSSEGEWFLGRRTATSLVRNGKSSMVSGSSGRGSGLGKNSPFIVPADLFAMTVQFDDCSDDSFVMPGLILECMRLIKKRQHQGVSRLSSSVFRSRGFK